jgi:hypothetical protein
MTTGILHSRKLKKSGVALAIAALDGNPNPLDMDMSSVDTHPTGLDLPEEPYHEMCSRCSRPAVGACMECGSRLCEDCIRGGRRLTNPTSEALAAVAGEQEDVL